MVVLELSNVKIGFCITGSFCTFDKVIPQIEQLVKSGAEVIPIFSYAVSNTDTRFTTARDFREKIGCITGNNIIDTIVDAEPIGPKKLLDIVVIAPCTGNTLAKLANGITDTPVLMATKAQLRNQKPVVIAISTNDALGNNAKNLGIIINTKNIFMVPFYQDGPDFKGNSLLADMDQLPKTIDLALQKKQIQPVVINDKSD